MKIILAALLLSLSAPLSLVGQEEEEAEERKPTGRLAWFVATVIPDDLENPVQVMTGTELTEVTLSKRMASNPVKIPVDGIIRIVRPAENPDDPEKPPYITLAQARVPEGVSKALIILVPAKKTESGLVFNTKVQDLAKFKGGDYMYLNLTPVNIAVELGNTKIGLKPKDAKIYEAPVLSKSTNVPVRYNYYHEEQQKWKMLSASTITLRPTRREICIFSWDPRYQRVDYHGITVPVTR